MTTSMHDEFKTLRKFDADKGREAFFYSLPALKEQEIGKISRLPVSIRIVLESVLRNCDGKKVRRKDVEALAKWNAKSPANEEIPFVVARIVLQDFTGVPLIVDLAAMRNDSEATQKSSNRSCRSIWLSITLCRSISSVRRAHWSSIWTWSSSAIASVTSFLSGVSRLLRLSSSFCRESASCIR